MIQIPSLIYQGMIEHARKERPLECCGILAGKGRAVEKAFELQNAEKTSIRYSMFPQEQLRVFETMEKDSLEMIAVYHSHPHTISYPSQTDVKLAFYPEVASVIISLRDESNPVMNAFRIVEEAIDLEEINVI